MLEARDGLTSVLIGHKRHRDARVAEGSTVYQRRVEQALAKATGTAPPTTTTEEKA